MDVRRKEIKKTTSVLQREESFTTGSLMDVELPGCRKVSLTKSWQPTNWRPLLPTNGMSIWKLDFTEIENPWGVSQKHFGMW